MAAHRTFLSLSLSAVGNIFLEGALHTVLPGVDTLALQLQRAHQLDDVGDRHAIAQHTRNQLGIVPVLRIELLAQSLDGCLIATFVLKLEVVALGAIRIHLLDDLTFRHRLRQQDAFLVVLQTGEYLVGITMQQTHKGHPFLLIILETHHIALQHLRAHLGHLRLLARWVVNRGRHLIALVVFLLLVFLRHTDHHARAAAVAIDGAALTARAPCLHIEAVYKCLIHIVRQVDGHADRVVYPFLDSSLHLHLHQPVHIVGGGFIIR